MATPSSSPSSRPLENYYFEIIQDKGVYALKEVTKKDFDVAKGNEGVRLLRQAKNEATGQLFNLITNLSAVPGEELTKLLRNKTITPGVISKPAEKTETISQGILGKQNPLEAKDAELLKQWGQLVLSTDDIRFREGKEPLSREEKVALLKLYLPQTLESAKLEKSALIILGKDLGHMSPPKSIPTPSAPEESFRAEGAPKKPFPLEGERKVRMDAPAPATEVDSKLKMLKELQTEITRKSEYRTLIGGIKNILAKPIVEPKDAKHMHDLYVELTSLAEIRKEDDFATKFKDLRKRLGDALSKNISIDPKNDLEGKKEAYKNLLIKYVKGEIPSIELEEGADKIRKSLSKEEKAEMINVMYKMKDRVVTLLDGLLNVPVFKS